MIPKKDIFFLLFLVSGVLCDEKSSLTFVIDDTSSMSDDIAQVMMGANAIFDTILKSNDSQIEDFVLITFNDPETRVRSITKDRDVFKKALSSINVYGGGDCPEYAMAGIIQGIIKSRPGSTVYTFTDASAKDHSMYEEARNIAIKKKIQVVFVLTGICSGSENSEDYLVYQKLANDTVGEVFHLGKTDIADVLKYVMENIKGRKTILAAEKFPPGKHSLNFTIDKKTKDPTVSVTGGYKPVNKPTLSVTKPDGTEANTSTIVDKKSISIVKILDPKPPGVYTVEVGSASATRVLVSARTDVEFLHGFSAFKPSTIEDTTTTPLPDVKSHVTIKLTKGEIELKTVKLLAMDGTLIKELPIEVVDEKNKLYSTELADLPDVMFKVAITGYDPDSDETITRVGSPISPQPKPKPDVPKKAPSVSISGPTTANAVWNKPLQLKCKVNGYPQPKIVWFNADSGEEILATVSPVDLPYDFISILDIDKVVKSATYQCKAENILGTDSTSVAVEVTSKPYFTIMKKPKDMTVNYLNEAEISCQVDANPPATITWYKDTKPLLKKENLEFSEDNTVVKIKEMHVSDVGVYMCETKNGLRRKILTAEVNLFGAEPPIIDEHTKAIEVLSGTDAVISCTLLQGFPKPSITWDFSDESSGDVRSLDEWADQQTITIHNADKSKAGSYSCLASNEIGSDYHEVELTVQYPAKIKKDFEELRVAEGEYLYISCEVEGKPDPVVTWYKNDVPLTTSDNIHINRNHGLRIKAAIKDNGIYTCNATNKLGSDSRVVKVDVYAPPIITLPKQTKMDVPKGSTLNLPCQARGHPMPNIEWTYFSFNPTVPTKSMLKSVGPSSIKLSNMQVEEEGYYTCKASNSGGQTNVTYEIHVSAGPILEKIYLDRQFKVVEGDLALMIKCRASGNPLPVIRWLKNGSYVTSGDDFTIENGTLIMKNLSKDAEGTYVCEASNRLGHDRDVYQVSVDKVPQPGVPTSTIVLTQGSSSLVRCDVPHKRTDQLRWYKNGVLIQSGELTITNAKLTESGLYTCRVGEFAKSTSGNTFVKVGMKPKFDRDEEVNIEYIEGTPYVLSCESIGNPKPQMTWWHNGRIMNTTGNYYYFEMDMGTHGQYDCEARNEFGSVVRSFNITPRDCMIDITQPSKLQPLIVSTSLNWPSNTVKNGYMSIPKREYVVLFCPNRFKNFPQQHNLAFCEGGSKFKIHGKIFQFSEFECTEKVTHIVENTDKTCLHNNTKLLNVVFNVYSVTVQAYEVCFDTVENRPLFTTVRMLPSMADVDYLQTNLANEEAVNLNMHDSYDCEHQISAISSVLGRWFHAADRCCFAKRMLVNPKDLFPGVPQRAAYSHLNIVPHWSTCNAESNNWNEVEQRVRTLVKATYSELVVSTGVADQLTLPDTSKSSKDIFITDRSSNQQAVSTYLWKVVQEPATRSSLVIIQVNVPDLLPSEAATYVRCRDICNVTKWMRGSTWYDTRRGFTYCCTLQDFENSFGYRNVFQPFNKVLMDASLIPEHSLT